MEVYYRGERIAFTELKEPLRTVVEPVRSCQNEQNRAQLSPWN